MVWQIRSIIFYIIVCPEACACATNFLMFETQTALIAIDDLGLIVGHVILGRWHDVISVFGLSDPVEVSNIFS